jgi:hypothetical protein
MMGCQKYQRITKFILLKDDDGESLAIGVCHSMCSDLVIRNEGPLGPNKVAIQITDLFVVEGRTSDWMFTLCAWNITYGGASLYDHDQVAI